MNDNGTMKLSTALLGLAGLGLLIAGGILAQRNLPSYLLVAGGVCLLGAFNRAAMWARNVAGPALARLTPARPGKDQTITVIPRRDS